MTAPEVLDFFVLIDMDRTLLDTNEWVDCLYGAFDLTPNEEKAEQNIERSLRGKGYDLFAALTERYGFRVVTPGETSGNLAESVALKLLGAHSDPEKEKLLIDGARELLAILDRDNVRYALMTKGSVAGQTCKLIILRELLGRPNLRGVIIPDEAPPKTKMIIDEWGDIFTGRIAIPQEYIGNHMVQAKKVVVIDDKRENTLSDDSRVVGVYVNGGESLPGDGALLSLARFATMLDKKGLGQALTEVEALKIYNDVDK